MIEVNKILDIIKKKRKIFHSEADFQHAFAWEIHKELPEASVRLEFPFKTGDQNLHVDVWIESQEKVLAVELKYKTRALSVTVNEEQYHLKNQSAQDIGRYDFIKDIQRLECIANKQTNFEGYAILITNDSAYWLKPKKIDTVDANFRIQEGRVLENNLKWSEHASDGTKKSRESAIYLQNKYTVQWVDFSQLSNGNYSKFRSLTIKVTRIPKPTIV